MANVKKKKKPILYPVVFMIAVTAIFTFVLASLNAVTIDRIDKQESVKVQRSLLYVFDQEVPESLNDVQTAYASIIKEETVHNIRYYSAYKDNQLIGYAFPFQGSGLWGTIWGYIAVSPEFDRIIGVDFIKHSETPGLGGRISEDWYREQFRGIEISQNLVDTIIYKPANGGNADVITGATLTSQSVRNMINAEILHLIQDIKGVL